MVTALADRRVGWLPPTATYDRREYRVAPPDFANGGEDVNGADCDFVLFILVTKQGTRWARTTWTRYAVQVDWEAAIDYRVPCFILENLDEPDDAGPLRCVVGTMREECSCECGWFDRRRVDQVGCKHRAALGDLVRKVVADGPAGEGEAGQATGGDRAGRADAGGPVRAVPEAGARAGAGAAVA